MSALFTSAGTSRARTAVKDRRRVLARASMMASNRLCPLATELTGLGGAAPPDTKAALQLDWRPRRGGSHQRGPLWAHLHCRDHACATLEVVHSAQCKSTLHCHSCWQDRFFTLWDQQPALGASSAVLRNKYRFPVEQRPTRRFFKAPEKKPTWTQTEVNCGRK